MKACWACGEMKSLEDFPRNKRMHDGRLNHCRKCWNARVKDLRNGVNLSARALAHREQKAFRAEGKQRCITCRRVKPLEDFYRNKAQPTGWSQRCKQCDVAVTIARQRADPRTYAARLDAWRERNPERAAANSRKGTSARRARIREAFVEQIDSFVVYDRDEGICGICQESVPRDHFDVDHVVPLALGGEHSYANVRLTHVSCNRSRGRVTGLLCSNRKEVSFDG